MCMCSGLHFYLVTRKSKMLSFLLLQDWQARNISSHLLLPLAPRIRICLQIANKIESSSLTPQQMSHLTCSFSLDQSPSMVFALCGPELLESS